MNRNKYWISHEDSVMRFRFYIPNEKIYGITYPESYVKRKKDEYGDYFSVSFDPNYISVESFCKKVTETIEDIYNVKVVNIDLKSNCICVKDEKTILHDIELKFVEVSSWVVVQYYDLKSKPVNNNPVIFKNHMSKDLKILLDALEDGADD